MTEPPHNQNRSDPADGIRINRFLAQTGLGSRRKVEEWIRAGRVAINGATAELHSRLSPGDQIQVDGRSIAWPDTEVITLALNKPPGHLVSRRSQGGVPTIYELLPKRLQHLHYAGRLDGPSRGLLLLSSDGDLIHRLTHPEGAPVRHYRVRLNRTIPDITALSRIFRQGIHDEGESLRASNLREIAPMVVELELHEGRKRQIRRMFRSQGYRVQDLYRFGIGELSLDDMKLSEGKHTAVTPEQVFGPVGQVPRRNVPGQ